MRNINVTLSGLDMDYKMASTVAHAVAQELNRGEPIVVAWHDKPQSRMSPVIEGADINTRWHDYGEAHGGRLQVDVNGEYDFIYADASEYETLGASPYVNVRDARGQEYLCQINALRDPKNPTREACVQIEEMGIEL
ncbi:MAG: AF1514 family protein [Sulfuricella sp.]|nr:AF1514 family protein [Sulfuricella sp.]